jgi:hypothetical protein
MSMVCVHPELGNWTIHDLKMSQCAQADVVEKLYNKDVINPVNAQNANGKVWFWQGYTFNAQFDDNLMKVFTTII